MQDHHLSILKSHWIEAILDGSKTIGYWFTNGKHKPYNTVHKGDIIYMKETPSHLVYGKFTASNVQTFDNLTPATREDIYETYGQQMFGGHFSDSDFVNKELSDSWQRTHLTLIHITKLHPFPNPKPKPSEIPRQYGDSWMVLNEEYQVQAMKELEGC